METAEIVTGCGAIVGEVGIAVVLVVVAVDVVVIEDVGVAVVEEMVVEAVFAYGSWEVVVEKLV